MKTPLSFVLWLLAFVTCAFANCAHANGNATGWVQHTPIASQPLPIQFPIHMALPAPKPPPADPLLSITTGPLSRSGKLVYVAYGPVPGQAAWQFHLVVREVGQGSGQAGTVRSYHVTPPPAEMVVEPEFSPDGECVLFKVGWTGDRHGTYRLYLLNLKTQKVQAGPPESLSYRLVYWSPDSKYLAYIVGGDMLGNESSDHDPLRLHIFNVQTGQSRFVAQDPRVASLSWTHQGTLLYTAGADIYEVAAAGGEAQKVISEGSMPQASPDGRWIAFFGSSSTGVMTPEAKQPEEEAPETRLPQLCLYNRLEDKRSTVQPMVNKASALLWAPNSQHLIVMATQYKKGDGTAHISAVAVGARTTREITTLSAKDTRPIARPVYAPQFLPPKVSIDGSSLFVRVFEIKYIENQSQGISSVRIVNLASGRTTTICQFKNVAGYDWYDDARHAAPS